MLGGNQRFFKISTLSFLLLMLWSCRQGDQILPSGTESQVLLWDTERLFRTVCDPFDPAQGSTELNGLEAELYYLEANQPLYQNVDDYLDHGQHADVDLFFSRINVPTTLWSNGFQTESGGLLVKPNQEVLYEYFGLKYEAAVKLSGTEVAGRYQFAILSDDGAILEVDDGGPNGLRTIVDNDGLHPTRMGCATEALSFDATTRNPMRLKWYQGPRYHISNILMWRRVPDGLSPAQEAAFMADPQCGTQGNNRFFDFNQNPPLPTQNYENLLAAGWRVLERENFVLQNLSKNPCAEEWDVAGRKCFTETFTNTQRTVFPLFAPDVDTQYLRVKLNGQLLNPSAYSYDPVTNSVTIPGLSGVNLVIFDYCQLPDNGSGCQGSSCGGWIGI